MEVFRTIKPTVREVIEIVVQGTNLAVLVEPIFNPEHSAITPDFARAFATEYQKVCMDEGKSAADYLSKLNPDQQMRLEEVLTLGGAEGTTLYVHEY